MQKDKMLVHNNIREKNKSTSGKRWSIVFHYRDGIRIEPDSCWKVGVAEPGIVRLSSSVPPAERK